MENQASQQIKNMVKYLGGRKSLGVAVGNESDLQDLVVKGIPKESVFKLQSLLDISDEKLANELAVTPRTVRRWREDIGAAQKRGRRQTTTAKAKRTKKNMSRLRLSESDRVVRITRLLALASEVLENQQRAIRWLNRPNRALGDNSPFDKLRTESGAREVEDLLMRIEYGVVA